MDGVTILAEHTVSNFSVGAVAIAAAFTIFGALLLWTAHIDDGFISWFFGVALVIDAFFFWIIVCCSATTSYTEYTVTIDDSASYNEFTKTYEVVSEEDGIYRVKLKEADQ